MTTAQPHPSDVVREIRADDAEDEAQRAYYHDPEANAPADDGWPEPIPLTRSDALPPFPVDALPGWMADYVRALSIATQTPAEMGAVCAIGTVAALTGGRIWARPRPSWCEGTNLYCGMVADPGTRKSTVLDELTRPVRRWERDRIDEQRPQLSRARAEREMLEARKAALQKQLARVKGPERKLLEQELLEACEELDRGPTVVPFRLIAGDVTPERLLELLEFQRGRLAIMADEDAIMGHLLGRYSRQPPVEPFLSAYSNKQINRDRMKGPPICIERPALTIVTGLQPELLRHAHGNALVKGRGLLDRFAFVVPRNTIGERDMSPPSVPASVRHRYDAELLSIADQVHDADHDLRFSDAAHTRLVEWLEDLETRRGAAGDLAGIQGWASKCDGLTVRLAAISHVAAGRPLDEPVGPESVEAAATLCGAFAEHALAAADVMGLDPELSGARAILAWASGEPFTVREAQRELKARFKKAADVRSALARLKQHGLARDRAVPTGGRPSKVWELSPRRREVLSPFVTVTA